jgi:TRAP-type C4-dicarboxylate transport system permease small subunit
MMTFLSRFLSRISLAFSVFGLLAMTGIILWQVFARYVLNAAPAWSEQASLLLMIYFILFAAAVGVREGFHIRLSMVVEALPEPLSRTARILSHCVVGGFGVALCVYGSELVAGVWGHAIPTLGVSRGVAYLPLPIAGGLIAFFSLEQIVGEARGKRIEPLWN